MKTLVALMLILVSALTGAYFGMFNDERSAMAGNDSSAWRRLWQLGGVVAVVIAGAIGALFGARVRRRSLAAGLGVVLALGAAAAASFVWLLVVFAAAHEANQPSNTCVQAHTRMGEDSRSTRERQRYLIASLDACEYAPLWVEAWWQTTAGFDATARERRVRAATVADFTGVDSTWWLNRATGAEWTVEETDGEKFLATICLSREARSRPACTRP